MAIQKSKISGDHKCDGNCCGGKPHCSKGGTSCTVYCLGIFGAAYYFFPHAVGFTGFMIAILKSLVWPALLVYQAFAMLRM